MKEIEEHLRSLLRKQVDEHGVVVWYDPDATYAGIADKLELPETTFAQYAGSFFALRYEIDGLLAGEKPPRLVVYVPLAWTDTQNALAEIEATGVLVRPGQQPLARNTRLPVVARHALEPLLGKESAKSIEQQIEAGKLTLEEVESLAQSGAGVAQGALSSLYGSGHPQAIALAFLVEEAKDKALKEKGVVSDLYSLLNEAFEAGINDACDVHEARHRLARHVLMTELDTYIDGALPNELQSVPVATDAKARGSCRELARTWRLRRDLRDTYAQRALQVEKEIPLNSLQLSLDQLPSMETFVGLERSYQAGVEEQMLAEASPELVSVAEQRCGSFWSEQMPEIQARWALLAAAGHVLCRADDVETRQADAGTAGIEDRFAAYTELVSTLDRCHRQMERRWNAFDFGDDSQGDHLERLVGTARQRYMTVAGSAAESFMQAYADAEYSIPEVPSQARVFADKVRPCLHDNKTAYILVDALRYEMGEDLAAFFGDGFEVRLDASLAVAPTVTVVGMGALMPGAEEGIALETTQQGELGLSVEGTLLKTRKERMEWLAEHAGVPMCALKVEDLLPKPRKKFREGIANSQLVVVTSQDIDELGEGGNSALARRFMDEVLVDLRRAVRVLRELGVERFVITADHGYIFGAELDSDMKVDPPCGETLSLHRRVWIGRGGHADGSCLRTSCASLGCKGDTEIASPWGFACFKASGGNRAYFHGGLSPQELVVPVLTVEAGPRAAPVSGSDISWTLTPGSRTLSTRFFSVQIEGAAIGLFEPTPPRVRVELRAKGATASRTVSASYGFQENTGDVQLNVDGNAPRNIQPNTIALMVAEPINQKTISVHLLNAETGAELTRLSDIPVSLSL